MVFAWRWARSRLLAGFQGCRRGAGDHGGPTVGQAKSYGPRIHRSRSAFAAPLADGQSRAPAIRMRPIRRSANDTCFRGATLKALPGEKRMTLELKLLVWSAALALLQMLVALLAAIAQVGLLPLVGNRENLPAFEGWAGRAQRAHRNMLESLIIFAALVLVAQIAGKTNVATALGAQLFFWGRLAYAPVYVIGIPWLRTGLWGVSFVGLLQILLQLL